MAPSTPVRHIPWQYVDGDTYQPGGAAVRVPIPANANIVELAPETQDVYYRINGNSAGAGAPGYIADGGREIIGPLNNWNSLWIYQAATGVTHVQWFQQKDG